MKTPEDRRATYLGSGPEAPSPPDDRLDLIRDVLSAEATWAEPLPGTFELIAAEVGAGKPELAVSPKRSPRLSPAWGIAAVLVVALFGFLGWLDRPVEAEGSLVAMTGTILAPEAQGTALVREAPAGWYIRLEIEGLAAAPEDTYYEGWVWRDGEGVSIGTFHLRGGFEPVALWSGVDPADYPAISVTLQDEGAGTAASERVVMRGRIEE